MTICCRRHSTASRSKSKSKSKSKSNSKSSKTKSANSKSSPPTNGQASPISTPRKQIDFNQELDSANAAVNTSDAKANQSKRKNDDRSAPGADPKKNKPDDAPLLSNPSNSSTSTPSKPTNQRSRTLSSSPLGERESEGDEPVDLQVVIGLAETINMICVAIVAIVATDECVHRLQHGT